MDREEFLKKYLNQKKEESEAQKHFCGQESNYETTIDMRKFGTVNLVLGKEKITVHKIEGRLIIESDFSGDN